MEWGKMSLIKYGFNKKNVIGGCIWATVTSYTNYSYWRGVFVPLMIKL